MKKVFTVLIYATVLMVACEGEPTPIPTPEPILATATATTEAASVSVIEEEEGTETAEATATPVTEPTAENTPSPTIEPTATAAPPKEVTICMATRPQDAYLYGAPSLQSQALRHAIYENVYTNLGFDYQPQGVEQIPTLDNGGFRLESVAVESGSLVVDASGEVILLLNGDEVVNAAGETVTFNGDEPLEMIQMVVEYTLKPMVWSDGMPVTADDSVFSFEVAADRFTLSDKDRVERTFSYEAVDDRIVRWTGLPGHREILYMENIWTPLPRHVLGGIDPLDLAELPQATEMPLSSGPFVITSWGEEEILLGANPHYYRAAEGLPHIDRVRLRFPTERPDSRLDLVRSGVCDVVTQDLLPLTAEMASAATDVSVYVEQGVIWEHIAFGITGYGFPTENRPDWFEDARARQAVTICTDRGAIAEAATFGLATVNDSYIPPEHPLAVDLPGLLPYSPEIGNMMLDELGYMDTDGDGIRQEVNSSIPFSITIATTESAARVTAATLFAENLAACGIDSSIDIQPVPTFFDINRDGTVFGRNFDAAIFAWVIGTVPTCEHYLSSEITGPEIERFAGWNGANVTGFASQEFDLACGRALDSFFGINEYQQNHESALRMFAEQRPGIPLFTRPKFMVATPRILNLAPDTTETSGLWNIAEWDIEQ